MKVTSPNFGFLLAHDPQLVLLGALAERYFKDDPNTSLIKLRQFGELLAQLTAARAGLFTSTAEPQADLLRRLKFERVLPGEPADLFHQLRQSGNRATHSNAGDHAEALAGLKIARQLGVWFHRSGEAPHRSIRLTWTAQPSDVPLGRLPPPTAHIGLAVPVVRALREKRADVVVR